MQHGKIVLIVPRKYSIDTGVVEAGDLSQRFAGLHFMDDLPHSRFGALRGCSGCNGGRGLLGDDQFLADTQLSRGQVVPFLEVSNRGVELGRDLPQRIAAADRVAAGHRRTDRLGGFRGSG